VLLRIQRELRLLDIQADRESSTGAGSKRGAPAASVDVEARRVVIRFAAEKQTELSVERSSDKRPGLVALAAVELLRARLLHPDETSQGVPATSATNEERVAASPRVPPARPEKGARSESVLSKPFRAYVGPALWGASGQAPVAWALQAAFSWQSEVGVYAVARFTPGLSEGTWEVDAGQMSHRFLLVGAGGGYTLAWDNASWALSLGGSVSLLRSSYETLPSNVNRTDEALSDHQWAAFPSVDAHVAWFVHPHFGIGAGGLVGAAFPELRFPTRARALPETASADTESGSAYARPGGLVSMGAWVAW
jgi:hypothetical protein